MQEFGLIVNRLDPNKSSDAIFLITPKRCDANLIDAMKISWINEQHFMENYDCSTKIAWLLIAGIHAILISWIHAIACNIDQFMLLRCCE